MTDLFTFWAGWIETGRLIGETLSASSEVVARRGGKIAWAFQNPFGGDYAEILRMVEEKAPAFAKAQQNLMGDLTALHSDAILQGQAIGMALTGLSGPGSPGAILARSSRMSRRASRSGPRALRPIHAVATANRRRLKKG